MQQDRNNKTGLSRTAKLAITGLGILAVVAGVALKIAGPIPFPKPNESSKQQETPVHKPFPKLQTQIAAEIEQWKRGYKKTADGKWKPITEAELKSLENPFTK